MDKEKIYPKNVVQRTDEFEERQEKKNLVGETIEELLKSEMTKALEKLGFKEKEGYLSVIAADEKGEKREIGKGTQEYKFNITISKPKNLNPTASKPISHLQKIVTLGGKRLISEVYLEIQGDSLQITYKNTEDSGFHQDNDGSTYAIRKLEKKATIPISDKQKFKDELKEFVKQISEAEAQYITGTKIGVDDKTEKNMNASIIKENKLTISSIVKENFEQVGEAIYNMVKPEIDEKEKKSDLYGTVDTTDGNPQTKVGDKDLLYGAETVDEEMSSQVNSAMTIAVNDENQLDAKKIMFNNSVGNYKVYATQGKTYFEFENPESLEKAKSLLSDLMINEEEGLEEITASGGNAAGGAYNTPYAFTKDGKTKDFQTDKNLGYTKVNENVMKTPYWENKSKRPQLIREGNAVIRLENKTPYVNNVEMEPGYINVPKGMTKPYAIGLHGVELNSQEELEKTGHGDLNRIIDQEKENKMKRKFVTNEENKKLGVNKRYIVTEKYSVEEQKERWKQLYENELFGGIQDECPCQLSAQKQDLVTREEGEEDMNQGFSDLNQSLEIADAPCNFSEEDEEGMRLVPKDANEIVVFKINESDIRKNKAYVIDHFTNKMVANPLFKK